ncbi:MAG: nitroreductase family protein [Bacteroidales bacterium]
MIELLKRRRSVRQFLDKAVDNNLIEKLKTAALLAPSSNDSRPWDFVAVNDKEVMKELSRCVEGENSFLKDAPFAIVVSADPKKSEYWIEDLTIAATYIQLVATKEYLGSCWVHVRGRMYNETITSEDYVKDLLKLPQTRKVECIIAIGYPVSARPEYDDSRLKHDRFHLNSYE